MKSMGDIIEELFKVLIAEEDLSSRRIKLQEGYEAYFGNLESASTGTWRECFVQIFSPSKKNVVAYHFGLYTGDLYIKETGTIAQQLENFKDSIMYDAILFLEKFKRLEEGENK